MVATIFNNCLFFFFFRFQENKQHMKEKAQAMISRERQVKQALDDFEQRQKNYNEQTVSS